MAAKKKIAQKKSKSQYEVKLRLYDPGMIEPRVREMWEKGKIFSPDLDSRARDPYYNLMMFPYPSAEGMHVGNMYAFTGSDIWGRYQRMQGFSVFEPIGLDGFGIHSENYAIKIGEHPVEVAKKTERRFYEQLHATGNAFDWTRTLETYNPDYYRWTQWLFIQMFKNGLAYREKATVNWCPSCKTVLADEQVINDHCERCGTKVELKKLEQWFFKITDYADRLLGGLDRIDWPERIKIAQRNWIGRSEGAEIRFKIDDLRFKNEEIKVFTTRPDTLFGATFMVLAPKHPVSGSIENEKVKKYINRAKTRANQERLAQDKEKTGIFSGLYAINPLNGEKIPIWIADYAVMGYGTGALFGDAHDERDVAFAKKYGISLKPTIMTGDDKKDARIKSLAECYTGEGILFDSGEFSGLTSAEAKQKIVAWLANRERGSAETTYHLRDWLISRQRYWGPPIPMIYCEACAKDKKGERKDMPGWYSVPEKDLPVELPFVENYQPRGLEESPLAQDEEWMKVNCPGCGKAARRETDVSDTFLDSSWYFFRYTSTEDKTCPWKPERVKKWLPVNMYIGGAEHSVLHLMYVRFVWMCLYDWGYFDFSAKGGPASGWEEPFPKFYAHGLLIKDGAKMSKSKGNVVVPDEYIKKYGADTLRMYLMFLGPFDQGGDFRDTGIEGMFKFIRRVWELVLETQDLVLIEGSDSREVLQKIHQTIKRVTEDVEGLRYNRAIAGIMEYTNSLRELKSKVKSKKSKIRCAEWDEALRTLVLLLAPFAPHITEELWQKVVHVGQVDKVEQEGEVSTSPTFTTSSTFNSVHFQPWPTFDPEFAQEEIIEIPVQVNGKLRGTIKVGRDEVDKQNVVETQAREVVRKYLVGVKKIVFVPGRLINFVV